MALLESALWYDWTWARRPPGMTFEDWQPWQQWLRTTAARPYLYAYDVELRLDAAPPHIVEPELREMWARSNARRIDAVGKRASGYTLFEARRHAGWSAVAQLLGYRMLWRLMHPERDLDELVLVTERIPDEIRALALTEGVRTWSVGDPE